MCENNKSGLRLNVPDSDSPNNILNKLNDDCLRLIFETSTLDHHDLLQLANVCHRFQYIATTIFQVRHKNFEKFDEEINSGKSSFEGILRTFGKSIKTFGSAVLNDIQCELALKHCRNVKELKCNIRDQETIDELRGFSERLEDLHIEFADFPVMLDGFGVNNKLKKLSIRHLPYNYLRLPRAHLPALIEVNLDCVRISGNDEFFRKNPQIQALSMSRCIDNRWPCDYNFFGSLRNLKKVEVKQLSGVDDMSILLQAMVKHGIPIEELRVCSEYSRNIDYLKYVGQIKSIQRLDLGCIHFDEFGCQAIDLATNLPNLVDFTIASEDYPGDLSNIRRFMENAGNQLKRVTFVYDIHLSYDEIVPRNEAEFDGLAIVAVQRDIDLRMMFKLCPTYRKDRDSYLAKV